MCVHMHVQCSVYVCTCTYVCAYVGIMQQKPTPPHSNEVMWKQAVGWRHQVCSPPHSIYNMHSSRQDCGLLLPAAGGLVQGIFPFRSLTTTLTHRSKQETKRKLVCGAVCARDGRKFHHTLEIADLGEQNHTGKLNWKDYIYGLRFWYRNATVCSLMRMGNGKCDQ